MRRPSCFLQRQWRAPPLMWALLVIELPLTIALLALFGIADPDLYRTTLWQEGSDHGFNSNPNEILYAYANHRPVHVPLPWRQFVTTFNLVISVLGTFILLTKVATFIVRVFLPLLSLLTHALLVALFSYSVYCQTASDYSDPDHPSKVPWYITHSCSISSTKTIKGYCEQAKAGFAVTVIMLALFAVHIPYSIWCMFPTQAQKERRASKASSMSPSRKEKFSPNDPNQQWEFQTFPQTPASAAAYRSPTTPYSPYTPRTQAFNSLGGASGPVPSQYSPHAGYATNQPYQQSVGSPSGGSLPLRERYGDVV